MKDNGWLRAPTHSNRSLEIILWLGISQSDFKKILGNVGLELGHSCTLPQKDKRPMSHIAHLRKKFNSINTYDYLNVNWEKKKPFFYFLVIEWFSIWTNLNPLHPRMLCAKFGWNWPIGSEEDWPSCSWEEDVIGQRLSDSGDLKNSYCKSIYKIIEKN